MKTKFNYSTQHYFPNHVKLIGIGFFIGGLLLFASRNHLASLFMMFIGAFILTTKYGMTIDLDKKSYMDYLSIFGFKKGSMRKFDQIESIYMTSGKKTTKMQLRGHATTISKKEYNGYIKFSEEEKIHLMSSEKKEEIEKLLKKISSDMNMELIDYSREG